jgi:DNA-directed RNA polymerase specialized sigma24 family protein
MSSQGSVTHLIGRLKSGDAAAAQALWKAYLGRVIGLARAKFQGQPPALADEEDVAASAFASFFAAAEQDQFRQLRDREDLWQLLMLITSRKALDLIEREGRIKRGSGVRRVDREANQDSSRPDESEPDSGQAVDPTPSPDVQALVDEECRRLLDLLGEPQLRSIAVWKLEGYTDEEIARMLGRTVRTVQRKMQLIRAIWAAEQSS